MPELHMQIQNRNQNRGGCLPGLPIYKDTTPDNILRNQNNGGDEHGNKE